MELYDMSSFVGFFPLAQSFQGLFRLYCASVFHFLNCWIFYCNSVIYLAVDGHLVSFHILALISLLL